MSVQPHNLTIETTISAMMQEVFDQVADGAGLAILRGPAGIGKTFALNQAIAVLEAEGVKVIRVTITPTIGGSVSAFVRAVLSAYGIDTLSIYDGVESLGGQLKGYPFRSYGSKVLFIVDEAQEAKTVILETLRGLWDDGEKARLGSIHCPAFGLALVGNDTFMGKSGGVKSAYFRPLLSRVTHNVSLPRPNSLEQAALAKTIFPTSEDLQEVLQSFGEDNGSFRAQAIAARQAELLAKRDNKDVSVVHLRKAIRMMGGK